MSILADVISNPENYNLDIDNLGECLIDSPIRNPLFVEEGERVYLSSDVGQAKALQALARLALRDGEDGTEQVLGADVGVVVAAGGGFCAVEGLVCVWCVVVAHERMSNAKSLRRTFEK